MRMITQPVSALFDDRAGYIHYITFSFDNSLWPEMSKRIENPTNLEIRSVIKFLNARNVRPAEICRQVCEVYGKNVMSNEMVRRWCRMFNNGRSNVENDERSGRPSLITDDLLENVRSKIVENRRITLTELSKHFPQISRSLLYEVISIHLQFNKVSSRWVSKTGIIDTNEIKDKIKEVDENQSSDAINQRLFDRNPPNSRTEDLSFSSKNEDSNEVCVKVEYKDQEVNDQSEALTIRHHNDGNCVPEDLTTQSKIPEVNIKVECEDEKIAMDSCVEAPQDQTAQSMAVVSELHETENMMLEDDIKIEYEGVDMIPSPTKKSYLTSVAKEPSDQMAFNFTVNSEKYDEYNNLMYDYKVAETTEQRRQRLNRERVNRWRARQSQETLDRLRQKDLERHAVSRAFESHEARLARRKRNAESAARRRRARILNSSRSSEGSNNPADEYELLKLNLSPAKLTTITSWPFIDPDKMIDSSPIIEPSSSYVHLKNSDFDDE